MESKVRTPLSLGILTAVLLTLTIPALQAQTSADRAKAGVGGPVAPLTPAKDLTPAERTAREEQWRQQIRQQLFIPNPLPPLEAKIGSSFTPTEGVIADRVTYQTADGMLVPAIVYRPAHPHGKIPGIVVVNGHGGEKFSWYAFYSGMMFAKAGAMVVTYDPIGEGERNIDKRSRAGSHDKIVDAPNWGQHLAGLMQVDVMQAVSYLISQHQVDPKRIAVVGYSMGAFISGITGAIDTRIHAVILSGGGVYDGPGGYFDMNPLPCQSPPYKSLSVLGDRGAVLYALNAARGPMLVMNGDNDTIMDMPHHPPEWFESVRQRAIALRGTDKNIFTTILYPGISHRTSWVDRDGVTWLNQQLHFPNWTAAEITAMPTTHISTWAKANNVDISASYMREDREGGLDALGTGLPGIKREDLMVLSDNNWQTLKDRLTYEAWAVKTLAATKTAP
jgi:pimeloyl-ACP methyl ester carboxylesterase